MNYIAPYRLTEVENLNSLVEHRNNFSLDFCELNVFETREQSENFKLSFGGFAITSMLRGKKIMHLEGKDDFEYVPGQTVMAPSNSLMRIDFPEAEINNPTQCTALVLDSSYLDQQLEKINSLCITDEQFKREWNFDQNELILKNNSPLNEISNRLINAFTSNDPFKDYQVDILLRELVLCLLKLQNLTTLKRTKTDTSSTPFHAVLQFITNSLSDDIRIKDLCKVAGMSKSSFYRSFSQEYGISPVQLILEERVKYAKSLLSEAELSIKEVGFMCGFNDPNYFSRAFRKLEGETPSQFRKNKVII